MTHRSRAFGVVLALAITAPIAAGAHPALTYVSTDPDCALPGWAPGRAGMIIALDEETGAFGPPTRAQVQALLSAEAAMLSRETDGLVETHHPSGAVGLDLQGRFQELAVARIGPDGRVMFHCVSGVAQLHEALAAPVQPAWEDR